MQAQIPDELFVKSSYSNPGGIINRCVAVARLDGRVAVRDTKDPNKITLEFTSDEWRAFVQGVKADEFNV